MKNKRWREYAQYQLGWSDPHEERLWKIQYAFKAGYDAGKKDTSQQINVADQDIACPECGYKQDKVLYCQKCGHKWPLI